MRTAFTFLKACHMHIDFNFFCVLWSTDLLSRSYKAMSVTSIKGGKKQNESINELERTEYISPKIFFFQADLGFFFPRENVKNLQVTERLA